MALARLLREVDGSEFVSSEVVATLDTSINLIRVRRDWWSEQSEWVRREVWKMQISYLVASDFEDLKSGA